MKKSGFKGPMYNMSRNLLACVFGLGKGLTLFKHYLWAFYQMDE